MAQRPGRRRAGAGLGKLALAVIAVAIAAGGLQCIGALLSTTAADADAIRADLLDPHLRKIRDHVGLEVFGGIMHLVKQLLLAGSRRHRASLTLDLSDDKRAILADFTDAKS